MYPVVPFVDEAVAFRANGVVMLPQECLWDGSEPCAAAVEVQVVLGGAEAVPVVMASG